MISISADTRRATLRVDSPAMSSAKNSPARPTIHPVQQRDFAIDIVRRLKEAGFTALWAGGCVRDYLLDKTPKDYDVATDATPTQIRKVFKARKTLDVGAAFGVIVVVGSKRTGDVEVATFRSDGVYSDGRRPDSVTFSSPEEDAQRRDFTINGMFYDPLEQKVFDFVGGERDLSQGYIRAIGDPHDRMREDKLRMLRAVRFTAHLEFGLARNTKAAVTEMASEIHVVSPERIAAELRRMLTDTHRHVAMELADEVGLLCEILPEVIEKNDADDGNDDEGQVPKPWLGGRQRKMEDHGRGVSAETLAMLRLLQQPSFELAFAVLARFAPDVGAICRRLRFSNDELDRVVWLVKQQAALRAADKLSLARLKRLLAHPFRDDLLSFTRVALLAENAELHPVLFCERYLETTPRSVLDPLALVTGDDLITLGLKPGPQFKRLLEEARDAQLNGELLDRDTALEWVKAKSSE
ncbi:MAG: CCA tRNA nucleotidyltransferase [Planctomycetia bacterium]|nr:CCA tRNA nucleotidyltransferase [Planctomycetia bacterium]